MEEREKKKDFCLIMRIYMPQNKREIMDKKPYYKQSGIVFAMIGIILLINAVDVVLHTGWLLYLVIGMAIVMIVYAIASLVAIEKKK
ncbi:MAG: DUF3784 domain-containing protein [Lachnospiraceae bacterium]|nr:DUF3784 domain-containing protein [Lachnospiraceae bacterium]